MERIGYDELLESRVKQLQEIDDMLAGLMWKMDHHEKDWVKGYVLAMRNDLAGMIRAAKEESAAF